MNNSYSIDLEKKKRDREKSNINKEFSLKLNEIDDINIKRNVKKIKSDKKIEKNLDEIYYFILNKIFNEEI